MLCCIGELCNGSTTDSDSVCWGSNPYPAAKKKSRTLGVTFSFYAIIDYLFFLIYSLKSDFSRQKRRAKNEKLLIIVAKLNFLCYNI